MSVYVTHGTKYHLDSACPRMTAGEDLWDGDSEDWWHNSGSFRREVDTVMTAAYLGKLPCLFCTDRATRVFPPLYGQTFGHEPVTDDREFFGEVSDEIVCARCWRHVKTWTSYTVGYDERAGVLWENGWRHYDTRVTWPCTSAVILGLASA